MTAQCLWCACLWQPAVSRQRVRQPLLASPASHGCTGSSMIPNFRRSSRSLGDLGMDATAEPMCCRGSGTARGPAGLGTVPHCRIARHCDSKGGIRNCTERKVNERRAQVPEGLKSAFSKPRSIVTGALHSKFGPASKSYFIAKRAVSTQHRYGNLNENSIFEYARSHKHEEVTLATFD